MAEEARPGMFETVAKVEITLVVNKKDAKNLAEKLKSLETGIKALETAIAILAKHGYDQESEAIDALEKQRDYLRGRLKNTLYELIGASTSITQLKIELGEA